MSRLARVIAGALALGLLGVLLAGGCGLRTSSRIRIDQRSVDTAADQPDISKVPPPPQDGASPADIVRGFLTASAADADVDHTFAKPFLAPGVVWADRSSAAVYDPETISTLTETVRGSTRAVRFTATSVGRLTSAGAFLPEERPLSETYELRRVNGQWRLAKVPAGVLLTPRDLARVYRQVRTYSYSPSGSVLVAEPGFAATDPAGLAGAALHALLTQWGIPSAPKLSATRSLATGLNYLGSVVVQNGVATVDLGREAFNVPQPRRPLLVQQIAATLGSVPGVFTVRVLVEERSYVGGPVSATIPATLQPSTNGPVLALAPDGSLEELTSSSPRPVKWTARDGSPQGLLTNPVASPDGTALAALRPTTDELVIADLHRGAAPSAVLRKTIALPAVSGGREMQPEWLDANRLVVAVGGANPRLELIDASTGALTLMQAPGLAALGPLSSVSVSRDGTRVVVVSRAIGARQAFLGRILTPTGTPVRTAGTIATGWVRIPTGMADVAAVSWSSDLELAVLGRPTAAAASSADLHAELVEIDGVSDATTLPPLPGEFEALVATPERPVISTSPGRPPMLEVGTKRWLLDEGQWDLASAARDPSYP
jgi:hypothetical protein